MLTRAFHLNRFAGFVACAAVMVGWSCAFADGKGAPSRALYLWKHDAGPGENLQTRIRPPDGFIRVQASKSSFAGWLRRLPMKPVGTPVKLYTGALKPYQGAQVAVVDIDIGRRDLQQCADAIMRLRAEWLFASGRASQIGFNYTGGGHVPYVRWASGERPNTKGRRWSRRARPDRSYKGFRRYMTNVFAYAGTYSLARELKPVPRERMRIGDVFIKGGFPGHAVLVTDMAYNPRTGEKRFLLSQSFMPAQNIHVLKNPQDPKGSPWYPLNLEGPLVTPEWTFKKGSLKRWPAKR